MSDTTKDLTEQIEISLTRKGDPESQAPTEPEIENLETKSEHFQPAYSLAMAVLKRLHQSGRLPKNAPLLLISSSPRVKRKNQENK